MKVAASTFFVLLSAFVSTTTASCGHGTSFAKRMTHMKRDMESGKLTKRVEVGKFGYLGTQGPTNWHNLAPENSVCKTSKVQSPQDITSNSSTLVTKGTLKLNFPNIEDAEFENLGTTIEVVMEGKNASTTVDGKVFNLKQFHFHTPGEHTINGEYFPLEMHMVHEAEDLSIAVIAMPFQLVAPMPNCNTPVLTTIAPHLEAIAKPGTVTETGPINFEALVSAINAQDMRKYGGSLTTPPCAEGLTFFIGTEPLPINVETFNAMKAVIGFNSRFIQNPIGSANLLSAR
ncbi:putative carbonic anhydrase [Tricladium varicosporioides]|nr:putative carbonic anhydrase [Hymenoscyphus varicosporioides]